MDMEDKHDSESGWGAEARAVNAGISSLATQSQNNHEQVMTLLRSLLSDPETDHPENESETLGLGWVHSGKVTSPRGTIASLRAEILALDQLNVDQDAKLFLQGETVDTLRESWSESKSELAKSKETIQGLQLMIGGHEKAMMRTEERNSVLMSERRDLQRRLDRALSNSPGSSWLPFFG
jgi:hypothetical protein